MVGNATAANLFYKHGANIKCARPDNSTPIFNAIIHYDWQMVDFLVKRGANLTVVANGQTPHQLASQYYAFTTVSNASVFAPHQASIKKIWDIVYKAKDMEKQLEEHYKNIPPTTQFLALSYLKDHPHDSYTGKLCKEGDTTHYSYVNWKGGQSADMMLVCERAHPLSESNE